MRELYYDEYYNTYFNLTKRKHKRGKRSQRALNRRRQPKEEKQERNRTDKRRRPLGQEPVAKFDWKTVKTKRIERQKSYHYQKEAGTAPEYSSDEPCCQKNISKRKQKNLEMC